MESEVKGQPAVSRPKDRVFIFDTTLRDGEQSPGASMTIEQKLVVARALADLGVDVIEAGFPASSPGDFESVRQVARTVEGPVICGLARAQQRDISRCVEALADASRRAVHLFIATSPLHRQFKLNLSADEVLARVTECVRFARDQVDAVEFSAEDAARTEPEFLAEVVERAIEAGATVVNLPDTVGYVTPNEYAAMIRHLVRTVRGVEKVVLSVHCHNDLGLAVANSLAGLVAGARQVECTINGIGERAGNCALEEVVMAIRTRPDQFPFETGVRSEKLLETSRVVSEVTGLHVQRNKAVVGANAFAHEAGIHQDGMLKNPRTYEIMRPEDVGFGGTQLVLGKHSGRASLRQRLAELGYRLDQDALSRIFEAFKVLADEKKEVTDEDLRGLVAADPASPQGDGAPADDRTLARASARRNQTVEGSI